MKPIVWTIAGSDSGGGAGIQADLKVMHELGVYGCSVITALTAQNTLGVQLSEPVSPQMLKAQLEALASDLPPAAIKTGMLGSAENCRILVDFLNTQHPTFNTQRPTSNAQRPTLNTQHPTSNTQRPTSNTQRPTTALAHTLLVCDPVLKSTSGANLLEPKALEMLKKELFPLVDLLTPNLPEAEALIGRKLEVTAAAEELLKLGVKSVLIKGGHSDSETCRDYWTDGQTGRWFESPRVHTRATHGTGCVLASAIAAYAARGDAIPDAIGKAKALLTEKLTQAVPFGAGHGPFI